jgi:hypothetical protein
VATGAFAAATAGLFAGTAPYQGYCRAHNKDQGKELLPFHAANITAKANPATGIFMLAIRLSPALASAKPVDSKCWI